MERESKQHIYQEMRALLNEKQWRHYLAMEAQQRGSVAVVAMEAGASRNTGRKVTDDELAALNLVRDAFHGEWNSIIKPQSN